MGLKHPDPKLDDDGIGANCDEAVELQKGVAGSFALNEDILPRMETIQRQLIRVIQDVEPAEADDLRTMLRRLNINHHVCLIQISNRTRALVSNEFVRRVMRIIQKTEY